MDAELVRAVAQTGNYGHIIWRSLLNAPPLTTTLRTWLQFLSDQQLTDLLESLDEQLLSLFDLLRKQRCLLILDNFESILAPNDRAGVYRPGYEGYDQLLQRIGESEHQSCLLLTSREWPRQSALLETDSVQVRTLNLAGLPVEPGVERLKKSGISAQAALVSGLVQR
jgi:hypothetical protein